MSNNSLTECVRIVNSWDPNYKEVTPETIQPNSTDWLTYTVHFQNTGTDTARLVVLKDTLSQFVDAASFQYLAASHHAVIQLDHNAMTFTFPHINLVDSATNPLLSEGWIQYRVKANANLPNGTAINNTAYIYFDNNPAVVTNTATTNVTLACTDTTIYRSVTLCYGDTFFFAGAAYATTDTFIDIFSRAGGCDSTYIHYVTVLPEIMTMIEDTICSGGSYVFAGDTLSAAGMYMDTLHTAGGCDSIIMLMLEVRPSPMVSMSLDSMVQHGYLYGGGNYIYWSCGAPDASPISGGLPAGGYYFGDGVRNDSIVRSRMLPVNTVFYFYTAPNGCTGHAVDTFINTGCLSIHEQEDRYDIYLYPNPNSGTFTLQTSNEKNSSYVITNMLGEVIVEKAITSDIQSIDMNEAAAGVYTLSVKGGQSLRQVRFVVVR